jgi:hypothetical protein
MVGKIIGIAIAPLILAYVERNGSEMLTAYEAEVYDIA